MNQCREMTVTYTFGEQSETLDSASICSWITGSAEGQIQLDMEKVRAYVKTLADKYDTAGTARTFHTATGRDVSVSGSFGWKIDQAAEADALVASSAHHPRAGRSMRLVQWTAVRQNGERLRWRQI